MKLDREYLGKMVRLVWVRWANEQPDIDEHPNWLTSWDQLPERDKEVDRRIGEKIARLTIQMIGDEIFGDSDDVTEDIVTPLSL